MSCLDYLGLDKLSKERLLKCLSSSVKIVKVTTPIGKNAEGDWIKTGPHEVELIADDFSILFSTDVGGITSSSHNLPREALRLG